MERRFTVVIPAVAWMIAEVTSCSLTAAQNAAPPSLSEQLQAQYKMVKMGTDSHGPAVLEAGTLLSIQKGGILGVPSGSPKACPAKYENGTLKPPSGWCTKGREQGGKHGFGRLRGVLPSAVADNVSDANTNTG